MPVEIKVRRLRFDSRLLAQTGKTVGQCAYIAQSSALEKTLGQIYGRSGLCLKVFRDPAKSLNEFRWQREGRAPGALLVDCTRIQNLFAWHGLAPRVFGIVLVNGKRIAQVTDYLRPSVPAPDWKAVQKVMKLYDLKAVSAGRLGWDPRMRNWLGRKLVDFQPGRFVNPRRYVKSIFRRAPKAAEGKLYQAVPALNFPGMRETKTKLKQFHFGRPRLKGKIVLDLGCNMGEFMRAAYDRGAKRVVGVDNLSAEAAYEVANWLGYWNLDFLALGLPKGWEGIQRETGFRTFDFVFAMSTLKYAGGYKPWVRRLCKPDGVLLLEGHSDESEFTYRMLLERDFPRVEFLGSVKAHTDKPRPQFICWAQAKLGRRKKANPKQTPVHSRRSKPVTKPSAKLARTPIHPKGNPRSG